MRNQVNLTQRHHARLQPVAVQEAKQPQIGNNILNLNPKFTQTLLIE